MQLANTIKYEKYKPLKFLNILKQLWRNESWFTEITWLWQFVMHSEPLVQNKFASKHASVVKAWHSIDMKFSLLVTFLFHRL